MNKAFILIAICSFSSLNALGKNHLDVEFKGELIHHDCQIAAGSINKQIQLGYLRKQYLNEHSVSDVFPFFIEINKCSPSDLNKIIRLTWQSHQLIDIDGNQYLTTQGASGALLGLIEMDKDKQPVIWNQPIKVGVVSVVDNRQQLNFGVFVRKPASGEIKTGDFKGTATFVVEYE